MDSKPREYRPESEVEDINTRVLTWLKTYQESPSTMHYDHIGADMLALALSPIQGAFKIKDYILGGFKAQYQFKVVYRSQPSTDGERLAVDKFLNRLGFWAADRTNYRNLDLGKAKCIQLNLDALSALFAPYEDGSEDHQILMTMIYEVI